VPQGQCSPNFTGPIWEFAPFDFGSFDPSVDAFYPTRYLGTPVASPVASPGKNRHLALCTEGFDNAGFFTGISSDTFVQPTNCTVNGTEQLAGLGNVIYTAFSPAEFEESPFGIVPNPFYGDKKAGRINERKALYMQDGGSTGTAQYTVNTALVVCSSR
jgi:lysophospholipase